MLLVGLFQLLRFLKRAFSYASFFPCHTTIRMASFTIRSANVILGNESISTHAFKSLASNTLTIGARDTANGTVSFLANVGVRTLNPTSALHIASGNLNVDNSIVVGSSVRAATMIATGNVTANTFVGSGVGLTGITPPVTIANVAITDVNGLVLDDTALGPDTYVTVNGTGATGFGAGCIALLGNVTASATTVISTSQIRARFTSLAAGTYTIFVINTNGTWAALPSAVTWSLSPAWSGTGVVAASTKTRSFSRVLALASGDSTLTYSVASGSSLPPGTSLSSGGTLSGNIVETPTSTTAYSFTIKATDLELQDMPKTFTLSGGFLKNFSGNANIVASIDGTYANTTYKATAIDPAGGFLRIIADSSLFLPSANVLVDNVATISSTYISATEVRAQVAPASNGTVSNIEIVNTDGSVLSGSGSLRYNTLPAWVTSATLSDIYKNVSFTNQLEATGSTSYANISALPAEITLSSGGSLAGNITSDIANTTVYSIPIDALNVYNQHASRTFSLSALPFFTRKLVASDKAATDYFGYSVSFSSDGSRVVVGAYLSDPGAVSSAGSAYIYSRSGTVWTEEAKIIASDKASSDYFGWSVSISSDGSRVVVGANLSDPGGTSNAGAAYVYSRSGTVWTQEAKIFASDKAASDLFGDSVSISNDGSRVVIGARLSDPGGTGDAGAAYMYSRSGTTWTEEAKIIASDKLANDYFGVSVSFSGDGTRVVVGARFSDPGGTSDAGAAYVYSRSGTVWTQEAKIFASDKVASDNFGVSVSISNDGSRVVVGANLSDPGGTSGAGAAYVFSRSGTVWTEEAKIFASDKVAFDQFGYSVSMSNDGSRVVVGANLSDPGGTYNAGAAYVYSRSGSVWTQEAKIFASDKVASDQFGQSVSFSGDGSRVVVGANLSDPGGTGDAGAAYVFSRSGTVWSTAM